MWFSIAMLVHQRVSSQLLDVFSEIDAVLDSGRSGLWTFEFLILCMGSYVTRLNLRLWWVARTWKSQQQEWRGSRLAPQVCPCFGACADMCREQVFFFDSSSLWCTATMALWQAPQVCIWRTMATTTLLGFTPRTMQPRSQTWIPTSCGLATLRMKDTRLLLDFT